MKVLLDENVHHGLRPVLVGHDVYTVQYRGWSGITNGKLLALADAEFDVLVTFDTGIRYENNLKTKRIGVITVVSKSMRLGELLVIVPKLLQEISNIKPGDAINIVVQS